MLFLSVIKMNDIIKKKSQVTHRLVTAGTVARILCISIAAILILLKNTEISKEVHLVYTTDFEEFDELWITRCAAESICKNYDADWNYDMIGVETEIVNNEEKDLVYGDDYVKVAILDSGVDFETSDANIIKTINLVDSVK